LHTGLLGVRKGEMWPQVSEGWDVLSWIIKYVTKLFFSVKDRLSENWQPLQLIVINNLFRDESSFIRDRDVGS
jgi:hypothetical protein